MEQVVSFLFKYRAAIFEKGQFGFAARPSTILIVALVIGLALLAYYLYARPSLRLGTGWRVALIALRTALVAVIVFCLMRPVIVIPTVLPGSTYVAVLMDDSSSMQLRDGMAGTRLDAVKQLMSAGSPFATALAEKFKVHAYGFSATAERVTDATELKGEGDRTDLQESIEQITRESAGLPVSGIILISDGANNGVEKEEGGFTSTLNRLRAQGLPVFTVGVGSTTLEGDVEIIRATAPRRSLAGSPVTAELLVRASGSQKSIEIELTEDSHPLFTRQVPVQGEATTVARITFTPSSPGLHRYSFTAKPLPDEPVADNNSQELVINVEDAHPRILYIEGAPRWEYGKLRSGVTDEKNVVLVSVLRSADGKFYRQGVESGDELATGFPKSEEELFKYDAIIIGSIEATFFTFDQLRIIEQFVSRRGGTLLALGGPKSFNVGGYANTPLADLLPVSLGGQVATSTESQTFKTAPSERGRDNPAARLADQPEANQKAWEQMPALTLPEIITETKPGATVILEGRDSRNNRVAPLLIEQRYGRGRSLALMASDTWRWRMMLESKNKSYETFWRNLLRYLVEGTRHTIEASTERSYYGTLEPVRLRAEVADEKFQNVTGANVTARVTTPTGGTLDLTLKPDAEGGFEGYSGTILPNEEGLYRIEVSTSGGGKSQDGKSQDGKSQGGTAGTTEAVFLAGPLNREAHDAAQNRELLERIATNTGGAYYTLSQAENLIEDLTHTESAGSVRESKDLWDMPINFLLIVLLAAAEWFTRKRKGLA